jgi:hypothetical protein
MAGLFASSDSVQQPRPVFLALPEVVVPVGLAFRVRRPLRTCSKAMQRVREMKDSSGGTRRGRQPEVEARHKVMQHPRRSSHRHPTAAGPPKRTKIANLSEASRVSSLQSLARMTTPIARDICTPRPLLLVAGSGHSSNLEALHNLHTTCLRKGDRVRVVLSTQHHLIRTY